MTRIASWTATLVVALAAVAGLILFINSRDPSNLTRGAAGGAAPGIPYRGRPALTAAQRAAVARGNVVVLYSAPRPPAALRALVPPGGSDLVRAGQGVVLGRDAALGAPFAAVARTRVEAASSPSQLQPFVDYWLGG